MRIKERSYERQKLRNNLSKEILNFELIAFGRLIYLASIIYFIYL